MENANKASNEFNARLEQLQIQNQPAHYNQNSKEIILYEKLMEIQQKLDLLIEKNNIR